jgi:hypothetical protein
MAKDPQRKKMSKKVNRRDYMAKATEGIRSGEAALKSAGTAATKQPQIDNKVDGEGYTTVAKGKKTTPVDEVKANNTSANFNISELSPFNQFAAFMEGGEIEEDVGEKLTPPKPHQIDFGTQQESPNKSEERSNEKKARKEKKAKKEAKSKKGRIPEVTGLEILEAHPAEKKTSTKVSKSTGTNKTKDKHDAESSSKGGGSIATATAHRQKWGQRQQYQQRNPTGRRRKRAKAVS